MKKTVILDTHVLYDIGLKRINIEDVWRPGERLVYSPISVIELVSKLDDWSFADRKAAASVILEHSIEELPDPESYLTEIFGYALAEPAPTYSDAVRALAEGHSLKEAQRGVPDFGNRVLRRLHIPFAATWREKSEQEWVNSLIHVMAENIPGFRKWYESDHRRQSESVPKLKKDEKKRFLDGMKSREWFAQAITACQMRAFIKADVKALGAFTKEKVDDLVAAIPKVECYTHMYTQYLIRLMTEGLLPKKNDSGDIDLFLYSTDDDHIVATNEKKWIGLAHAAGYIQRIRTYGCGHKELAVTTDRNCPDEDAATYRIMRDAARYRKMSFEKYVQIASAAQQIRVKEEEGKYRNMTFEDYIETRPGVRDGKPCFKGTRITVYDVLDYLAGGMTEADLLNDFPVLSKQHIRAAHDFEYAHNLHSASGSSA